MEHSTRVSPLFWTQGSASIVYLKKLLLLLLYTEKLYGPKVNLRTTLLSIFINASALLVNNHRRVYLFGEFDLI